MALRGVRREYHDPLCAQLVGPLHLCAQAPRFIVDGNRTDGAANSRHLGSFARQIPIRYHDHICGGLPDDLLTACRHELNDPVDTTGKSDTRRFGPSLRSREAVVTASRCKCVLLPGCSTWINLEDG